MLLNSPKQFWRVINENKKKDISLTDNGVVIPNDHRASILNDIFVKRFVEMRIAATLRTLIITFFLWILL